jgi:hypothetical protein
MNTMKNNLDLFINEPIILLEKVLGANGKWGLLAGYARDTIIPCICDSIRFGNKYEFMAKVCYKGQTIVLDRHSDFGSFLFFAEWGIPYSLPNESILVVMPPLEDADISIYEEFIKVIKETNQIIKSVELIRNYCNVPSVKEYLDRI